MEHKVQRDRIFYYKTAVQKKELCFLHTCRSRDACSFLFHFKIPQRENGNTEPENYSMKITHYDN